jgi:hypothetical protein
MKQLQVMEKELNIKQKAQAAGLSAHTLRYNEWLTNRHVFH